MSMTTSLGGRLAEFRALRHEIEANVLALATSVDGRRFTFQAPLEPLELRAGGYVELTTPSGRWLGQLLSLEITRIDAGEIGWAGEATLSSHVTTRLAAGEGAILSGPPAPFHDAGVRPAEPAAVRAWLHATAPPRAVLPAGELRLAPGVTLGLDAGGFDRHTFLCGQSGSGKTYALGVLIERLLLETGLRMVILDPNSDFVRLAEVRADVDPALARRFRAATVRPGRAPRRGRRQSTGCDYGWASSGAAVRPRCCSSTRSRTARSTPNSSRCSTRPRRRGSRTSTASPGPAREALARRARNLGVDAGGSGRVRTRDPRSTRSTTRPCAASSSTSDRSARPKSSRSSPKPCSIGCGDNEAGASRC